MAADLSQIQAGTLFSVNGLVAVITGGGSGLGAYMARALATNGASKVFIIGRREEALKRTAESVSTKSIIPVIGDVTDKSSLEACVEAVKKETDKVDVLVCNSGIGGPSVQTVDHQTQGPLPFDQLVSNLWKPSAEDVTSTYAVNLTGVHFTVAAFLPLLNAANQARPQPPSASNFRPRPQIITTSSIGGFNRVPLGNLSYGPSKAGVIHMTKQLSTLLVPYDIRANTIAPGLYFSEMTQGMYNAQGKGQNHNVEGNWPKSTVPATRTGDEEDMAGIILWLCSRAGAYINGQVVVTDGGRLGVVPNTY